MQGIWRREQGNDACAQGCRSLQHEPPETWTSSHIESRGKLQLFKSNLQYYCNYSLDSSLYILCHQNFNSNLDLGRRFGTERDKLSLQQTMKNLGFDVTAHDDLTYHEVAKEVEKCMYFTHKHVIFLLCHFKQVV